MSLSKLDAWRAADRLARVAESDWRVVASLYPQPEAELHRMTDHLSAARLVAYDAFRAAMRESEQAAAALGQASRTPPSKAPRQA